MNGGILDNIEDFIGALRKLLNSTRPAKSFKLSGVILDPTLYWVEGAISMQMTDSQNAVAHIGGVVDSDGNPAKLDSVTWESSDSAIVTVDPSTDGMSCVVGSPIKGPLGSAVVTVSAKSGTHDLSATLAVDIIAGDAVAIEITTDEPSEAVTI